MLACPSDVMPFGSSSIIVQSLKTLQQNGPKLKNISNNKNTCFDFNILSLWLTKEKILSWLPEYNNSYWDTKTGTNSSNYRLILCQNIEINSNEYFSYDIFSGMKSSTMWNGNTITQSPKRKMSWVQRCFKYQQCDLSWFIKWSSM